MFNWLYNVAEFGQVCHGDEAYKVEQVYALWVSMSNETQHVRELFVVNFVISALRTHRNTRNVCKYIK